VNGAPESNANEAPEPTAERAPEPVSDAGPDTQAWLELALAICDEADALALGGFRRDLHIRTKPDRSLVTQVDEAIERHVRERILAAYPDHGLVGEEYGEEAGAGATRWYVDPIDATHNFVRGVPVFATLVAAEHQGRLQVAVVSAPALGQRWFAHRGGGAWARAAGGPARRLRTSAVGRIEDASLAYSSPASVEPRAPGLREVLARAWRDRGFGDFWGYALLAEGAVDAMVEVGIHSWDLAAPTLLVEEAGGRVTDFRGRPSFAGPTVLASNGPLHEELLRDLRGVP
jgi:histidinol-phosphatase